MLVRKAKRGRSPGRSTESIRHHYEIERVLADRLRRASREERSTLYGEVYDELFRKVPDHPQLERKRHPARAGVGSQVELIERFVGPDDTFLEIGAGDCAVSMAMAGRTKNVVAVDVSKQIATAEATPTNFELRLTDGRTIPAPDGSIDVAFSNQLMEHLHVDDAREQLREVFRALAPRGTYICITPNRLSGPHDVSGLFDRTATGFHLKEYTTEELAGLFHDVGFTKMSVLVGRPPILVELAAGPVVAVERLLACLPPRASKAIARRRPVAMLLGTVVAVK